MMTDCIFCRIINQEIPANIAYEDDQVLIFHDLEPMAPIHLLAIPKKHIINLNQAGDDDASELGHLQIVIGQVAEKMGFAAQGYRVISNCGKGVGQAVMHLHYHVMSGRPFSWPPG
ncbi:MAG: histidine triad nucleotide-binding protein [Methylocystaceae bacterium]